MANDRINGVGKLNTAKIKIGEAHFYMRNVRTRMPFKYGVATLTSVPILHLVVEVEVEGRRVEGVAADILPPKWFDKDPAKDYEDNVDDLLFTAKTAASCYADAGRRAGDFFSIWQQGYAATLAAGDERGLNHLTAAHGSTLMERALIDATGRALNLSYYELLRDNVLALDLGVLHDKLQGVLPVQALAPEPLTAIHVRHTVGLADPIRRGDIADADRLADGLPQALEQYISAQGIRYFKVKVNGDLPADIARLAEIASLLDTQAGDYSLTLDGNEQYRDMDSFLQLLDVIEREHADFWRRILYIEQPLERSVALDAELADGIGAAAAKKPMLVDESDGDIDTFARAIDLGYTGVSSKACKGLVKAVANAALAGTLDAGRYFLTGEDLMNLPVVPLHQDLTHLAALGVAHAERNGHHYVRGLAHLSQQERQACLSQHGDMYGEFGELAALDIRAGQLEIASLQRPGLGVGVGVDTATMVPLDEWTFASLA
ncbi:MAG: hypothetical protein ACI906_000388 [Candidatus Latescibacterota bacterium]